jgi:hypothetical protein
MHLVQYHGRAVRCVLYTLAFSAHVLYVFTSTPRLFPVSFLYTRDASPISLPPIHAPRKLKIIRRVVIITHLTTMAATENWAEAKEEDLRMGSRDKRVGWYTPTLSNLTDGQRDLLENYSKTSADRVIPHVLEVVRCSGS